MTFSLAVHGGAWNIPDELWPAHQDGCRRAHAAGSAVLRAGGDAASAVVAAIRVMEDDPVFDAGFGSFLNEAGNIELDAGLMEGGDLHSGAVLGVSRVKHPIELAHRIMRDNPHCVFTREGAHRLAVTYGLEEVAEDYHIHEREVDLLARIQAGDDQILADAWTKTSHDTVGAVALDRHGHLAAGNSTGGTINKSIGRVGDAPLIGAGFYADDQLGAVVCTGWGEPIMRSAMAMHALFGLRRHDPQQAAEQAVTHLRQRVGGFGGLLLMTPQGQVAVAYNTERMAYRLADS